MPDTMSPVLEVPLEDRFGSDMLGNKSATRFTVHKKGVSFYTKENKTFCVACVGKPLKGYKIN